MKMMLPYSLTKMSPPSIGTFEVQQLPQPWDLRVTGTDTGKLLIINSMGICLLNIYLVDVLAKYWDTYKK